MGAAPKTLSHAQTRKKHYRLDPESIAKPHLTTLTGLWDPLTNACTYTATERLIITTMPQILVDDPLGPHAVLPVSMDQIGPNGFRLVYPPGPYTPDHAAVPESGPAVHNYVGGGLTPGRIAL